MAIGVSISGTITCAIPRNVRRNRKTHRHNRTLPPALPYPKPSPTPLLPSQSTTSLHLTPDQFVDAAIHHLESSSDHLSHDPDFLLSVLRRVRIRSHVRRLRDLIPLPFLRRNLSVLAALVQAQCDHGLVRSAHELFDEMPARVRSSTFLWNCLISAYTASNSFEEAIALYHQMGEDGVPPDRFTFPRVIKACAGIGQLSHGRAVHRDIVRSGFGRDLYALNSLTDMYGKCGDIRAAREVFEAISERDLVSWNSMIVGYTQNGFVKEAVEILAGMLHAGFEPDFITISNLISAFTQSSRVKVGLEIHAWAIRHGLIGNVSVGNSLIGLYLKLNKLSVAREIFESMPKKDSFSWNAIISAHRQNRQIFVLFDQMIASGFKPDKITFISLLSSCANLGLINDGKRLFYEMQVRYKIKPNKEHYGCLINMLAKAGRIKEAHEVVQRMPFAAGRTIWGALLYACSVHGDVEVGEVAAKNLLCLEPENGRNLELIARVYEKVGRLDEVERIKRMMVNRGLKELV